MTSSGCLLGVSNWLEWMKSDSDQTMTFTSDILGLVYGCQTSVQASPRWPVDIRNVLLTSDSAQTWTLWLTSLWCLGGISEWYIMSNMMSLEHPSDVRTDVRLWRPQDKKTLTKWGICGVILIPPSYWPKPDVLRTSQGRQIVSWVMVWSQFLTTSPLCLIAVHKASISNSGGGRGPVNLMS